jgi:hypothetical protein
MNLEIPFMATESGLRPGRLVMAFFGMSTKECGRNTHNGKAISWIMQTSRRTVCLSNLENLNAHFVSGDRGSAERLLKLNLIAIHQVTFPWRIRLFDQRGR